MKKYFLFFFFSLYIFAQNLLLNPGFESWNGNNPEYWNHGTSSFQTEKDSTKVQNGAYSCRLILDSKNTQRIEQNIQAIPNRIHSCSVSVYDSSPFVRLRLYLRWYDSTGNYLDGNYSEYSTDSSGWQRLGWNGLSPDFADSLHFEVRMYDRDWGDSISSALSWIDNAVLRRQVTQSPVVERVWHRPTNPSTTELDTVFADIVDEGYLIADTLFYRINSILNPHFLTSSIRFRDTLEYVIPQQNYGDTVFYFVKLVDDDSMVTVSDTNAFFVGEMDVTINEVYYDNPGADTACFLELWGPSGMSLDGWKIAGVNGSSGEVYSEISLDSFSISGDGFFLVAQDSAVYNADIITDEVNFQNGDDNIELRYGGITIDALGYGGSGVWFFTGEGRPAEDVPAGVSLSRYPDGEDSDNNFMDFKETSTRTPGYSNSSYLDDISAEESEISVVYSPVTDRIKVEFSVKNRDLIEVSIFNILGQEIEKVMSGELQPGYYEIKHAPGNLPSGVYFVNIRGAFINKSEKFFLLR